MQGSFFPGCALGREFGDPTNKQKGIRSRNPRTTKCKQIGNGITVYGVTVDFLPTANDVKSSNDVATTLNCQYVDRESRDSRKE